MHNPDLIKRLNCPCIDMLTSRLILENHSLRQLNIIDDSMNSGPYSSVLKHLNKCITPMGKRKLENILLNPTTDIDYLSNEYDMTDYIINNLSKLKFLNSHLTEVKDIERLTRQIILRKIPPNSIVNIYNNLETAKNIFTSIQNYPNFAKYLSNCIDSDIIETADMLRTVINNSINIEVAKDIDTITYDINFIREGVNDELDQLVLDLNLNNERIQTIKKYLHELIATYEKKNTKKLDA